MSFLKKLTDIATGGLGSAVKEVAGKYFSSKEKQAEFDRDINRLIAQRNSDIEQSFRTELTAKQNVMVAELQQGDNYTKRARPTVIYTGLFVIVFNYVIVPLIKDLNGLKVDPYALPIEFWVAWGGTVGVYNLGRSMEKRGIQNKFTQMVTGSNKLSLLE